MGDFVLQPEEDAAFGAIGFSVAPAPTAGFYQWGVIPGCLRDGVVTQAGAGGLGFQPAGEHSETPGYRILRNSDPGYLLGFDSDPCIAPGERVVIAVGGYSATEPVTPEDQGWTGTRTVTFPSGKQMRFTIVYNAGTNVIRIDSQALGEGVTWDGASYPGYYSSWNSWAGTDAGATVEIQCGTAGVWSGLTSYSFSAPNLAAWDPDYKARAHQLTPPVNCATGQDVRVFVKTFGTSANGGTWVSNAEDAGAGFDAQAMVVRGLDLGSLVYNPHAPEFEWMAGQCGDMECVKSYCSEYSGIDLVGWLGCFFSVDVSPLDWFQSLWENVKLGTLWTATQYTFDLLLSYPRSLVGLDGDCGMLFDLQEGPLTGLSGDTCSWPYRSEVRGIGAAFVYILGAMTILRLVTRLMVEGNPGYFGFGSRGESQGTLW